MYYDDGIGDGGWRWIDDSSRWDDLGGDRSGMRPFIFFSIRGVFFCDRFLWDRDLTRDLGSAGGSSVSSSNLGQHVSTTQLASFIAVAVVTDSSAKDTRSHM